MSFASWFWFTIIALVAWGWVAFLQKVSTNHMSSEAALLWLGGSLIGFQLCLYRGQSPFAYSARSLTFATLSGLMNWLGTWAMLAALRRGGKASVVTPFTALYPLIVAITAPLVLRESITRIEGLGIGCALVAAILLSR